MFWKRLVQTGFLLHQLYTDFTSLINYEIPQFSELTDKSPNWFPIKPDSPVRFSKQWFHLWMRALPTKHHKYRSYTWVPLPLSLPSPLFRPTLPLSSSSLLPELLSDFSRLFDFTDFWVCVPLSLPLPLDCRGRDKIIVIINKVTKGSHHIKQIILSMKKISQICHFNNNRGSHIHNNLVMIIWFLRFSKGNRMLISSYLLIRREENGKYKPGKKISRQLTLWHLLQTCCHKFLSSFFRMGFTRKSTAPFDKHLKTKPIESWDDITADQSH